MSGKSNSVQIRSVAKALSILNLLAKNKRSMALTEIAYELDLPKSTLHGLLSTMKDFGYIEQSIFDGKYRLGTVLFEIGNVVAERWDVRKVAAPYLSRLVNSINETVHLVILDKGEVLYIDKRESNQSLKIVSQIGARLPAHCTGVGKTLLAYLSPVEVKKIIEEKGLPKYTENTITDPIKLEKELARIRELGYGEDRGEIMNNLYCVAAPIWDYTNKVCAALSVSLPYSQVTEERRREVINCVIQTTKEISIGLGYRHSAGIPATY